MQKVLIFSNREKEGAQALADDIEAYLQNRAEVVNYRYDPHNPGLTGDVPQVNFALCIGGDGTALYLCRALVGRQIPILAINYGHFGFIAEFSPDAWREEVDRACSGEYETEERILIDVEVLHAGRVLHKMNALNDVVVSVAGISRLMRYTVYIADQLLAEYRADGLIVATPTGSTAYSVAAGGPILHPTLPALIVNPICPFTLAHRPIVVPTTEEITVMPRYFPEINTVLTVDGQETLLLREDQTIRVNVSDTKAILMRSKTYSFYETIRQKLKWSGAAYVE